MNINYPEVLLARQILRHERKKRAAHENHRMGSHRNGELSEKECITREVSRCVRSFLSSPLIRVSKDR